LHAAHLQNGAVYTQELYNDLQEAINWIAHNRDAVQYTLLVSVLGMCYDSNRAGGVHHVRVASGRYFEFSVRFNASRQMILLAVACS
jgi:hypothetical protein